VLKGDPGCPDLTAASVHGAKPVHFLSMLADSIWWAKKEQKVHSEETQKEELAKFLWLNISDNCSNQMGGVGEANQLQSHCRFDHWVQLRKGVWKCCCCCSSSGKEMQLAATAPLTTATPSSAQGTNMLLQSTLPTPRTCAKSPWLVTKGSLVAAG